MTSLSLTPTLSMPLRMALMLTPCMVSMNASIRVREVEVVVDLVDGRLARRAVLELERADRGFDFVGRGDRGRDCGGRLRGGQAGQCQHGAGDEDCQGPDELLHSFVSFVYCTTNARLVGRVGWGWDTGDLLQGPVEVGPWRVVRRMTGRYNTRPVQDHPPSVQMGGAVPRKRSYNCSNCSGRRPYDSG